MFYFPMQFGTIHIVRMERLTKKEENRIRVSMLSLYEHALL